MEYGIVVSKREVMTKMGSTTFVAVLYDDLLKVYWTDRPSVQVDIGRPFAEEDEPRWGECTCIRSKVFTQVVSVSRSYGQMLVTALIGSSYGATPTYTQEGCRVVVDYSECVVGEVLTTDSIIGWRMIPRDQ